MKPRANPTFLPLQTLFTQSRSRRLQRLIKQAQTLQALEDRVSEQLPPSLRSHCKVAAIYDDVLVMSASSAAWATRLRYLAPSLLEFLQQRCAFSRVRAIRIKISLPETAPLVKPACRPRLSKRSAKYLERAAQAITDPALRSILLRLANRAYPS